MSSKVRSPAALAVSQVDTGTVGGTVEAGDLFTITIGGKTLSVAAPTTSTSATATAIAAAFEAVDADLYQEFGKITAAANGSTVTFTADDEGVPFTVTLATTEANGSASDGQTWVDVATTANAGPNCWGGATNWAGGVIPANTDDVYLENSEVGILYDLAQSGVALTSLSIAASFEAHVGLPQTNDDGYPEYRATYLAIGATTVTIGAGQGDGSGLIRLNTGTGATTITVHKTATTEEEDVPSFCWKGTNANNVLNALSGDVGVAFFGGETATVLTMRVVEATVRCGSGCTLTTVELGGSGSIELRSACTTLTLDPGSGTVTLLGTGNITAANVWDDATLDIRRSCTIATLNASGTVDLTNAPGTVTFTNATLGKGAAIIDPEKRAVFTNGILLNNCEISDVTLTLGASRTLAIT